MEYAVTSLAWIGVFIFAILGLIYFQLSGIRKAIERIARVSEKADIDNALKGLQQFRKSVEAAASQTKSYGVRE